MYAADDATHEYGQEIEIVFCYTPGPTDEYALSPY